MVFSISALLLLFSSISLFHHGRRRPGDPHLILYVYEKSDLLPRVSRNESGRCIYTEQDISKLRFIIRAKKMNFSLSEIADLLQMRQKPQAVKDEVRLLTA